MTPLHSSDRLAWLEWRWHLRHPWVVMGLAVLAYFLVHIHHNMWFMAFNISRDLVWVIVALEPTAWLSVFWSWWALRREHRDRRNQDLILSSLRPIRLLWIKLVPISTCYVLCVAFPLALICWEGLDMTPPAIMAMISLSRWELFWVGLRPMLYELLYIGFAAPLFTAAWMAAMPRRASSPTCIVVPSIALGALMSLAWNASLLLIIHLSAWDLLPFADSMHSTDWLPFFRLIIQGIPTALIAIYVIPRFKRIYAQE